MLPPQLLFLSPSPPQPANSSPTPADTNTPAAADTYYNGVANLGRNPVRWIDKDGNGKIDIEVDFSAGPGKYFRKLGLTGYSQLSPEQKRELLDQMADLSFDTNLVFHEKGAIKNPDGKINFGNYAHVPSNGKTWYKSIFQTTRQTHRILTR